MNQKSAVRTLGLLACLSLGAVPASAVGAGASAIGGGSVAPARGSRTPAAQVSSVGDADSGADDQRWVRGMTISCQTWGWEWGSDGFGEELDELQALGVNWVAIHPYARIANDGSVSSRAFGEEASPVWIRRPIEEAQRRGMSVLVKPHLAYWGSRFRWRGEIEFEDPALRARFFDDYERWIVSVARASKAADAFAVGTELERLTFEDARWRQIIAAVRAETGSSLTYAANWDAFDKIPFWDALDAVGVQAYFPLVDAGATQPAGAGALGTLLRAGWERVLPPLRAVAERTGKPVVFTEIGYDLSLEAALEPWNPVRPANEDREQARAVQEICLDTALTVLEEEREWLRGAFLWKWFVGESRGEDFLVDTPHMRRALNRRWAQRERSDG